MAEFKEGKGGVAGEPREAWGWERGHIVSGCELTRHPTESIFSSEKHVPSSHWGIG